MSARPRRRLRAGFILAAGLLSACATSPIVNPGFELSTEGNIVGWRSSSPLSRTSIDTARHHSGDASLRIEKKPGEGFADVLQFVDAAAWRGKTIVLTAYVKSEGTSGTNGIWVRADGPDRKMLAFAASYSRSLAGSSDWVQRRAVLQVPPEAARLAFGAVMSSEGAFWADDFRLADFDPRDLRPLSSTAEAYLMGAEAKIRKYAYFSSRVDWNAAGSEARVLAEGAQLAADTYPAIEFLLRSLGDHHSFFLTPQTTQEWRGNAQIDFRVDAAVWGRVAYIKVPGFVGVNPIRTAAFRDAIRKRIEEGRAANACAWIVDLREDTGGNMHPMLDGLAPLLGDGTLGYYVYRDGSRTRWYLERGEALGGSVPAIGDLVPSQAPLGPVAVLTGDHTASSGEVVAVSFRGLANARSFGQPTFGNSSANAGFGLNDGAMIELTTSLQSDRTGRMFGGPIAPDQEVAPGAGGNDGNDPVIGAATRWLAESGCRG